MWEKKKSSWYDGNFLNRFIQSDFTTLSMHNVYHLQLYGPLFPHILADITKKKQSCENKISSILTTDTINSTEILKKT